MATALEQGDVKTTVSTKKMRMFHTGNILIAYGNILGLLILLSVREITCFRVYAGICIIACGLQTVAEQRISPQTHDARPGLHSFTPVHWHAPCVHLLSGPSREGDLNSLIGAACWGWWNPHLHTIPRVFSGVDYHQVSQYRHVVKSY